MGDLLPGGGPMYFPTKSEMQNQPEVPENDDTLPEDDERRKFNLCAECVTQILLGDEDFCPICRKNYCEECFEDHDCGFTTVQAEASDM